MFIERPDLPHPLIAAIQDPYYSEGLDEYFSTLPKDHKDKYAGRHLSATTLARSPRSRVLAARHASKILKDPLDNIWMLLGHVIHSILEKHPDADDMIEKRLGVDVDGVWVHGQVDRYIPRLARIEDWKLKKAASMLYPDSFEYVAQQNILAWLFRKHGYPVEEIGLAYIFRDHDPRQWREGGKYPKEPFMSANLPMWSDKVVEAWIRERVRVHMEAEKLNDDELPFCTDEERWVGDPSYKVFKIDIAKDGTQTKQKRAKLRCNSKMEAQMFCDENSTDSKGKAIVYRIEEIKARPTKCFYCDGLDFCNQRQAEKAHEQEDDE